jgi:hypothetical protein
LFFRFLPYCFATPRNATGHGKGEVDARFAAVAVFSTPPSFGHLPYILRCKTQRRRVLVFNILALPLFSLLLFSTGTFPIGRGRIDMLFLIFFSTPSPFGHSPYIPFRNTEGERYASLFSRYRRY